MDMLHAAGSALLIILAGAVCIPTLPISLYPTLAPPQVTVTSNYVLFMLGFTTWF